MKQAIDSLFDEAHELEACGCDDCGRAGLQWGPMHDGSGFWVAFVFIDAKGRIHRAEQDGRTINEAARRLLDQDFAAREPQAA
jgi:hypothetical protein